MKLTKVLKRMLNSESEIEVTGFFRIGDIRHNLADITKAKNYLNYKPKFLLGKGLKRFLGWVKTTKQQNINYEESIILLKRKNLLVKPMIWN